MSEKEFINILEELIGLDVIDSNTGGTLGKSVDLTINPTDGAVTGLLLVTEENKPVAIKIENVYLGKHDMRISGGADSLVVGEDYTKFRNTNGSVCGELLNSKVVAKDGRLLGRISDAYITDLFLHIIYRVSEPGLLGLIGRSFYLSGTVPCFFSKVDRRLIVPAETPLRFACRSIEEAVRLGGRNEAETVRN